jgi:hypothetical protein
MKDPVVLKINGKHSRRRKRLGVCWWQCPIPLKQFR